MTKKRAVRNGDDGPMRAASDAARRTLALEAELALKAADEARLATQLERVSRELERVKEAHENARTARENDCASRDEVIRALERRVREIEGENVMLRAARDEAAEALDKSAAEMDGLIRASAIGFGTMKVTSDDDGNLTKLESDAIEAAMLRAANELVEAKGEAQVSRAAVARMETQCKLIEHDHELIKHNMAEITKVLAGKDDANARQAARLHDLERVLRETVAICETARAAGAADRTETDRLRSALERTRAEKIALERELDAIVMR
ncbi:unnamed product [Ostreococcus tauri]|uniref:Unnamed product n=1 Tax=Ostreococcus tauri TaxID=70448 RepID=Q00ZK9_OSTTA|nr:unnamed product [Ostreococcus tauri]CAL56273.1 unnamed product [Ostreococcus tauri]|eukprot:XP_003081748.1 unnamed product [Ostreococcus tauri]